MLNVRVGSVDSVGVGRVGIGSVGDDSISGSPVAAIVLVFDVALADGIDKVSDDMNDFVVACIVVVVFAELGVGDVWFRINVTCAVDVIFVAAEPAVVADTTVSTEAEAPVAAETVIVFVAENAVVVDVAATAVVVVVVKPAVVLLHKELLLWL